MTVDTGVRVYRDDPPMASIVAIRRSVFVEEQGIPADEEFDGRDDAAIQFLAFADGRPVATARLRTPEVGVGKVERVAVRSDFRGAGWGRTIVSAVEDVASQEGVETLVLHAQTAAEEFYQALDYETSSDVYREVGIPHVTMEKRL